MKTLVRPNINGLYKKVIFLLFYLGAILLLGTRAEAQTTNNPFSRLGLGDVSERAGVSNLGMGGVGVSLPTVKSINLQNPALLSFHRLTIFEAAGIGEYKDLKDNGDIQTNDFGSNLAYLNLSFPLKKNWSMNLGFQPYSTVRYDAVAEELLPFTSTFAKYEFSGRGGVSQAFIGTGLRVFDNLSLGGQVNFNFGAISNTSRSILDDGRSSTIAQINDRYNYSEFTYRLGVHYFLPVFNGSQVNIGINYDGAAGFEPKHFRAFERTTFTDIAINSDTLLANVTETISVPQSLTIGLSIQKGYLEAASSSNNTAYSLGIDYSMQNWSETNIQTSSPNRFQDFYQISIGGEVTPNVRSTGYLKRTAYRIGFSYSQTPIVILDEPVNDMRLTFGLSLPVKNNFSSLNIYGAVGERGNLEALRERYVRFGLGVAISDRWFVKTRFD